MSTYNKMYYETNKDSIKAYSRKYRETHKDRIKKLQQIYRTERTKLKSYKTYIAPITSDFLSLDITNP